MNFSYKGKIFSIEGVSDKDHIYKTMRRKNTFYEEDLLNYLHNILNKPNEVTIGVDVGANIGNHSIYFQSFVCNHLIAIEPNKSVLPILHKNLNNNITNFKIYECAVAESAGKAHIVLAEEDKDNIGMATLSFDIDEKKDTVNVSTVDAIVNNYLQETKEATQVSFIKIDVEGMEIAVLNGSTNTLDKYKPDIFAEAATKEEYLALCAYLIPRGYCKLGVWATTPVYHFSYKPKLFTRIKAVKYAVLKKINRIRIRINKLIKLSQSNKGINIIK